ncbi:hypothetical protein HK102_002093 [Quaeritorhiza haematococci]|nr:hypothetical protein HK102_002093 [Quaeritorhiza haematococci]
MDQIQHFFGTAIIPYQSMLLDYFNNTNDAQNTLIFGIILSNKGFLLTYAQDLHRAVIDQISNATGKAYVHVFSDVISHASTFQMFTSRARQIRKIDDIIQQNLISCLSLPEFERTFLSGQTIARGGQAKISHHCWEEKGLDVAVKKFTQLSASQGVDAAISHRTELFYLFRLSGIAQFLNVFAYVKDGDNMYVVMEWMDRGSLADLIGHMKSGQVQITFAILLKIVYGILCAGATLANLGIVHADIKPRNFLLNQCYDIKLADFGAACEKGGDGTLYTPKYVAPEFHDTQADHKWDCYSAGKTLDDLVFFHPCMERLRDTHLQEISHIINKLTSRNADLRMTCEEAISVLVETSFNMEAINQVLKEGISQRTTTSKTGLSIRKRTSVTVSAVQYRSPYANTKSVSEDSAAETTVSGIGYRELVGNSTDRVTTPSSPTATASGSKTNAGDGSAGEATVTAIGYRLLVQNSLGSTPPPPAAAAAVYTEDLLSNGQPEDSSFSSPVPPIRTSPEARNVQASSKDSPLLSPPSSELESPATPVDSLQQNHPAAALFWRRVVALSGRSGTETVCWDAFFTSLHLTLRLDVKKDLLRSEDIRATLDPFGRYAEGLHVVVFEGYLDGEGSNSFPECFRSFVDRKSTVESVADSLVELNLNVSSSGTTSSPSGESPSVPPPSYSESNNINIPLTAPQPPKTRVEPWSENGKILKTKHPAIYAAGTGFLEDLQKIGRRAATDCVDEDLGEVEELDSKRVWAGETALMTAAAKNHAEICEWLVKNGADPEAKNKNGSMPLHYAAHNNSTKACQVLLRNGADPNAKSVDGWTPLHCAAWNNATETCSFLLKNGADPNAKNKGGCTPLHVASLRDATGACEVLLNNHVALVNAMDNNGSTPLHYSALNNAPGACKLLLYSGVDPNAQEKDGDTALEIAQSFSYNAVVDILLRHTAGKK